MPITHCLGLGYETMVCAVCLSIFFCNMVSLCHNELNYIVMRLNSIAANFNIVDYVLLIVNISSIQASCENLSSSRKTRQHLQPMRRKNMQKCFLHNILNIIGTCYAFLILWRLIRMLVIHRCIHTFFVLKGVCFSTKGS